MATSRELFDRLIERQHAHELKDVLRHQDHESRLQAIETRCSSNHDGKTGGILARARGTASSTVTLYVAMAVFSLASALLGRYCGVHPQPLTPLEADHAPAIGTDGP